MVEKLKDNQEKVMQENEELIIEREFSRKKYSTNAVNTVRAGMEKRIDSVKEKNDGLKILVRQK